MGHELPKKSKVESERLGPASLHELAQAGKDKNEPKGGEKSCGIPGDGASFCRMRERFFAIRRRRRRSDPGNPGIAE